MSDVFDKEKRSEIMRSVKSNKNKSTELKLIDFFKRNSITGWRRNYNLKGNPDFVFRKERVAIFTDGCFWHGHDCRNTSPSSNKEYWNKKISKNKLRDKKTTEYLKNHDWHVIRIWECEMSDSELENQLPNSLLSQKKSA